MSVTYGHDVFYNQIARKSLLQSGTCQAGEQLPGWVVVCTALVLVQRVWYGMVW